MKLWLAALSLNNSWLRGLLLMSRLLSQVLLVKITLKENARNTLNTEGHESIPTLSCYSALTGSPDVYFNGLGCMSRSPVHSIIILIVSSSADTSPE